MLNMGPQELVIIGGLAVLLFGKNLPDVARTFGKKYAEFRRGLSEMQAQLQFDDDIHRNSSSSSSAYSDDFDDYEAPSAPKFEPPESEPTPESEEV